MPSEEEPEVALRCVIARLYWQFSDALRSLCRVSHYLIFATPEGNLTIQHAVKSNICRSECARESERALCADEDERATDKREFLLGYMRGSKTFPAGRRPKCRNDCINQALLTRTARRGWNLPALHRILLEYHSIN